MTTTTAAKPHEIRRREIDFAEIDRYLAIGRMERAKAVRAAFAALSRRITNLFDPYAAVQNR